MKSFAQAADLTYIDPNVIRRAVRFLVRNQNRTNGEYKEKGIVLNKGMQVSKIVIKVGINQWGNQITIIYWYQSVLLFHKHSFS